MELLLLRLVPIVLVVAVVVAVVAVLVFAKRYAEENTASWRAFAAARGLHYAPGPTRLFGETPGRMDGAFDGLGFTIDQYSVSSGKSSHTYSRVRARAARPVGAGRVSVYDEYALSGLGSLLGLQDVVVGVPAFDARFVVKAERDDDARQVLDPQACHAFLGFPRALRFTLEAGSVSLSWSNVERDPATLDAAVRLVVAVCRPR